MIRLDRVVIRKQHERSYDSWNLRLILQRGKTLKRLGFPSWTAYTQSHLWQTVKAQHIAHYPVCKKCDQPSTQVHARDFHILTLKEAKATTKPKKGLIALCDQCFNRATLNTDGTTKTPHETNSLLYSRTWNKPRTKTSRPRTKSPIGHEPTRNPVEPCAPQ